MVGGRTTRDSKKDARLSVRRTVPVREKGAKAGKDPNKPKRPASAFFVFMEEFRQTYKENHPKEKRVSVIGKAGGDKWKSMSEADKAPYVAKANKRKGEYEKNMAAYNKGQLAPSKNNAADDESDKSKSEVNDDDEEEGSGEEGDDE